MPFKRITYTILIIGIYTSVFGQIPDTYDLNQSVGKMRIHLETGNYLYQNSEKNNYYKFGYGAGVEGIFTHNERSKFSLGFGFLFNGVNEELKTYSVENSAYYYRSTTLTGRLVGNPSFLYKYNIGRQFQIGLGFQANVVLAQFKDQYILGESISPIPDIQFQRTEVSLLASVGYVIDQKWMVNLIGQYAMSPLTQGENPSYVRGLRMQLSRRIK